MPNASLNEHLESLKIDSSHRGDDGASVPRWIWLVLSLVAIALVVTFAMNALRSTQVQVARVVSMEVREAPSVLVASGYIVAHHKIQLSSKVIGKVAWVGVEKGDIVKRDQVLVRLENQEYKA